MSFIQPQPFGVKFREFHYLLVINDLTPFPNRFDQDQVLIVRNEANRINDQHYDIGIEISSGPIDTREFYSIPFVHADNLQKGLSRLTSLSMQSLDRRYLLDFQDECPFNLQGRNQSFLYEVGPEHHQPQLTDYLRLDFDQLELGMGKEQLNVFKARMKRAQEELRRQLKRSTPESIDRRLS